MNNKPQYKYELYFKQYKKQIKNNELTFFQFVKKTKKH